MQTRHCSHEVYAFAMVHTRGFDTRRIHATVCTSLLGAREIISTSHSGPQMYTPNVQCVILFSILRTHRPRRSALIPYDPPADTDLRSGDPTMPPIKWAIHRSSFCVMHTGRSTQSADADISVLLAGDPALIVGTYPSLPSKAK